MSVSTFHKNVSPDHITYENIKIGDPSIMHTKPFNHRRTTVMVSLANPDIAVVEIQKLMEAGMNVARFRPSFSTNMEKVQLIGKVDKAAKTLAAKHGLLEWPCATCIELKTYVVKTGVVEPGLDSIELKEGNEVTLTNDTKEYDKCNEHRLFVDNKYLAADSSIGMEINIRQDYVLLKIIKIYETSVKCTVIRGGQIYSLETVCMRGAVRTRPYLTAKDLELAKLAIEYQVDMITINYVRHANTIKQLKKFMGVKNHKPFIVSGICTAEGLRNIDEIIQESDAMLISKEYLPYELERTMSDRMCRIQKWIIGKCIQAGKPVFVSGQILYNRYETNLQISYSEMSDVANALLDGVSGFVIRECDDVEKVVYIMNQISEICTEIEPLTNSKDEFNGKLKKICAPVNAAIATVTSGALLANHCQASVIIVPTASGRTIYHLNFFRPIAVIIAVTTKISTFRLLQAYRSVIPLIFKGQPHRTWEKTVKARVDYAIAHAVENNFIKYGDYYVTLERAEEESTFNDACRIYTVTQMKKPRMECLEYEDEAADSDHED